MENLQKTSNNRPTISPQRALQMKIILAISAVVGGAATVYWWWNFSGLYKILADVELRLLGSYGPGSTAIMTASLAFAGVCVPIAVLFRFTYWRDSMAHETPSVAAVVQKPAITIADLRDKKFKYPIVGMLIGVGLLVTGVYSLVIGLSAGTLTTVDPSVFVQSLAVSSHYISISGEPNVEQEVIVTESGSNDTYYVPLYSSAGDLLVILQSNSEEKMNMSPFTGVLSQHLEGLAREEFQKNDMPVSDATWVLNVDETPGNLVEYGIFGSVGALLIGGFSVFIFRKRMRTIV